MLKQSNNIIFPSHEQFLAYVNGNMAIDEAKNFKMAVESDAFLADALEGYQNNSGWVNSITDKVNADLSSRFSTPKTAGGKYFYIAGGALLVVVISIFLLNQSNSGADEKVITENHTVNKTNSEEPVDQENTIAGIDDESESNQVDDQTESTPIENANEDLNVEEEDFIENNEDTEYEDDIIENVIAIKSDKNQNEKEASNYGKSARLAVINVQIAIKENPSEGKSAKSKIVNGQIVRVGNSNQRNYSQADLPSYYGGDGALEDEIKGSIKPVVVTLNEKYKRVIGFDFIVEANGKVNVKTLHFIEEPYPEIKKQIVDLIKNLPDFKKGKAVGKKGRIRYSIMLKY